ncbi:VCBS repeat-containing protein [Actinocorallia longicatena]|uniref:FG-GAP-like repeat-containing protein n=1 Tax=Actinocorallia longicatena TaxID=111803 RepID=A0ABP6QMA3_9ACTN
MRSAPVLVSAALLAAALAPATAAEAAKKPAKPYDFDGDGRRDVSVIVPDGALQATPGTDLIAVRYGTGRRQVLTRKSAGLKKILLNDLDLNPQAVSADFDRDGYADLAGIAGPEGVNLPFVIYGSKKGLSSRVSALPTQAGILSANGLTVGDFNGNGRPDLALGLGWGASVFYDVHKGGRTGARPVSGTKAEFTQVSAGDFNGDGKADLFTIGDDGLDEPRVLFGSRDGLRSKPLILPIPLPEYTLNRELRLASADYDGDGDLEVAISVPGAVKVYGQAGGPLTELTTVSTFPAEAVSLATGDLDKDGRTDLAIGFASEDKVRLFYGSRKGLRYKKSVTPSTKGVPGGKGRRFGVQVRLSDVTGDGRADLVVAVKSSAYILRSTARGAATGRVTTITGRTFGLKPFHFDVYWGARLR